MKTEYVRVDGPSDVLTYVISQFCPDRSQETVDFRVTREDGKVFLVKVVIKPVAS